MTNFNSYLGTNLNSLLQTGNNQSWSSGVSSYSGSSSYYEQLCSTNSISSILNGSSVNSGDYSGGSYYDYLSSQNYISEILNGNTDIAYSGTNSSSNNSNYSNLYSVTSSSGSSYYDQLCSLNLTTDIINSYSLGSEAI